VTVQAGAGGVAQLSSQFQPALLHFRGNI